MKNFIFLFWLILISNIVNGQYSYSYVEPCTKKLKSIQIPTNQDQITVNYYGNVKIFGSNDFYNGNFASWIQSVSSSDPSKPCGEIGIILTKNLNMIVAQTSVTTILNVNSVTQNLLTNPAFSSFGQSAVNSTSSSNVVVNEKKETPSKETPNPEKSQDQSNSQKKETTKSENGTASEAKKSPENKTEEVKPSGGSAGSATSNSVSNAEDNSGTGGNDKKEESKKEKTNSEKTQDQSNQQTKETPKSGSGDGTSGEARKSPEKTENKPEEKKSSGGPEGSTMGNSVSNAEENSGTGGGDKKGGSKVKTGSIIGTGDIVLLRSAEDDKAANQYRITGSLTRTNTTNTRVWGMLYNFTTQINLSNITLYRAWVLPKSQWTIIGANSSMLNPDRDAFNTTTLVASKRFKGNWKKLTLMSGLNFTTAKIGESNLNNLSSVGGGFFSYNLTKKVSGSLLCLAVYSPFTHFYEGKWWESGILLVPFNSWDYSITKTFKFNMSFSGVYEMNNSVLNYQVLMGGKILL
jgi:hypothetical protein